METDTPVNQSRKVFGRLSIHRLGGKPVCETSEASKSFGAGALDNVTLRNAWLVDCYTATRLAFHKMLLFQGSRTTIFTMEPTWTESSF